MIDIGIAAPDFELPSNLPTAEGRPGKPVKLTDYLGKKNVVLAFYPLDFSPTCSGEHGCLRDDISQLDSLDAQVLGISVDSVWTHQAFAKQLGITYPLLADFQPRGEMATRYGLFEADKGITARATVIIDKQGKVAWVQNHGLGTPRDDKQIVAALEKLGA